MLVGLILLYTRFHGIDMSNHHIKTNEYFYIHRQQKIIDKMHGQLFNAGFFFQIHWYVATGYSAPAPNIFIFNY